MRFDVGFQIFGSGTAPPLGTRWNITEQRRVLADCEPQPIHRAWRVSFRKGSIPATIAVLWARYAPASVNLLQVMF